MSWSLIKYATVFWNQHFCPEAELHEGNLPSQAGRVFIVTGGNSGVGAELAKILYNAGGTVYIMTRDESRAKQVMADMEDAAKDKTSTPGAVKFIHMDLCDLRSVQHAAKTFLEQESRLDVLWNNAGGCGMDPKLRTEQGIEIHHGINCVAPFLLTTLLYPILEATARAASPASVRIIWTSSIIVDVSCPKGGMDLANLDVWKGDRNELYAATRLGNWFLASEFDRRFRDRGVLNITQNPGTLSTRAWRNARFYELASLQPFLSDAIYGARTSLWSGLWPSMTMDDGGRYVVPWGRWHPGQRPDIVAGLKSKAQGGSGIAESFYEWCDGKAASFTSK